MTTMETKTPRTDAEEFTVKGFENRRNESGNLVSVSSFVASEFARELETELTTASDLFTELEHKISELTRKLEVARNGIINALDGCSWCNGSGQDNDGEEYINEPCPKCSPLNETLKQIQ